MSNYLLKPDTRNTAKVSVQKSKNMCIPFELSWQMCIRVLTFALFQVQSEKLSSRK